MSHKPNASWILNVLFSLTLQSLLFSSDRNAGQNSQDHVGASEQMEQGFKVTVLVHNYAHLPARILGEAQDRASLIFRRAGVEIQWADCPLKEEDPALYPGCPKLFDASQLFLRILPMTASKMDHGGESFVAARIANIFWNRIEESAQRLTISTSRFLGHTIAHELGHLLLGHNSHSPTGIMTARWDVKPLVRICQEGLYFNRQQSELIRSEMRKRKGQMLAVENALLIPQ
jgi:hypothetical protein